MLYHSDLIRVRRLFVAVLLIGWLIANTLCGQGPLRPGRAASDPTQESVLDEGLAPPKTIGLNLLQLVWTGAG